MSDILGVKFSDKDFKSTIKLLSNICDIDTTDVTHVITANPETLMKIRKDKKLKEVADNADIITPDGIGIVIASKLLKQDITERVTGFDTVVGLFKEKQRKGKIIRVYMLGADEDTVRKAVRKVEEQYNCVQIVGYHNGFFTEEDETKIVKEINRSRPDLLLVAMGVPRQEYFIYRNKQALKTKLAIGVGGTFDVLSGNVKRAPESWQKLGIEWLYRLLNSPSRIFRQMSLVKFLLIVFKETLKTK